MTAELHAEQTAESTEPQHTLHIMDLSGDTRHIWDTSDPNSVEIARAAFNAAQQKGYLAYTVTDGGSKGQVVREFDPEAGALIMTPQLVGG